MDSLDVNIEEPKVSDSSIIANDTKMDEQHDTTEKKSKETIENQEPNIELDEIHEEVHVDASTDLVANKSITNNTSSQTKKEIKKPTTSFFVYLSEMRPKIIKDNPAIAFKDIPKVCSEMYKKLSPEDRAHYDNLAKMDKLRYAREIEEYRLLNPNNDSQIESTKTNATSSSGSNSTTLEFPLGRIKRIIKLDNEIKNISKEALVTITKSTELFIGYLVDKTSQITKKRKGKVLKDSDLYQSIFSHEPLQFLRLDIPKPGTTASNNNNTAPPNKKQQITNPHDTADQTPKPGSITSFFVPTIVK